MEIDVAPLEPTATEALEAAYDIYQAQLRADAPGYPIPGPALWSGRLRHPRPGQAIRGFLARLDGTPAGYLHYIEYTLDNLDNATADVVVHPRLRRRGVGRALYQLAMRRARDAGRRRLITETIGALPGGPERSRAGAEFALTMGAKAVLTAVRRRLDVTALDEAALAALLADAWRRACGYTLLCWSGLAAEEHLADLAHLEGRLVADAPMGELEFEPERVDAERVRAGVLADLARGRQSYHTALRHDATGRLVALSSVTVERDRPEHAWQQITLVDPQHRGRRLGTVIKLENLRHARTAEPSLKVIDTFNAESNTYMININESMGYQPVDTSTNWQHEL